MQRKFRKEGLWSLLPRSKAQEGGIKMITTEIPEEEVVVEAWIGMIVTGIVEGTEITAGGVGVAVIVLNTIEVGGETVTMIEEAIGADQLKVPLRDEVRVRIEVFHHVGVLHLVVHLVLGVVAQRSAASMNVHQFLIVWLLPRQFLRVGKLESLVAPHLENHLRREVSTLLER